MGDGQTVFMFCVVYSGILSLVIFASMFARERRLAPLPPRREAAVPNPASMNTAARQEAETVVFKKQA